MDLSPCILVPPLGHQTVDQPPMPLIPKTTSQKARNPARRSKFSRGRAAAACQSCRGRKVRCDVVAHGSPCYNCQQDAVTCVLPKRRRRCATFEGRDSELTSGGACMKKSEERLDYFVPDEDACQQEDSRFLNFDAMSLEGERGLSLNANTAAVKQSREIVNCSLLSRNTQLNSDFNTWLPASAQGSSLPGSPGNSSFACEVASPSLLAENQISGPNLVLYCCELHSSQRERELDAALLRQCKDVSQLAIKLCETALQMTQLLNSKIILSKEEAAGSEGVRPAVGTLSLPPTRCNIGDYGGGVHGGRGESPQSEVGERGFESYETWFMDMMNCGTG